MLFFFIGESPRDVIKSNCTLPAIYLSVFSQLLLQKTSSETIEGRKCEFNGTDVALFIHCCIIHSLFIIGKAYIFCFMLS